MSSSANLLPWSGRAILLIDLDAFFASVEQLDHPEWRGKPVIVGGSAERRGVVSTCSYEARKYGVHSAMPSWRAQKLCPDAIWTHGNYLRYSEVSRQVMGIIWDETPLVQQVSIDEAFADVSPGKHVGDHPVIIAQRICDRVRELGITCSVGLGSTKTIAKIASDMDKPDGLTVVYPKFEQDFLAPLPVGKISGIGSKTQERLQTLGISTIGDLAKAEEKMLHSIFGVNARTMLLRARGIEDAQIETSTPVKSVSNEQTFAEDLTKKDEILAAIDMLASRVARRLRNKDLSGYTITLKVRYRDLSIHTAQRTGDTPVDNEAQMIPVLHELLDELWTPGIGLRLVGVGISEFGERPQQLSLFELQETEVNTPNGANALNGVNAPNEANAPKNFKSGTARTSPKDPESAKRLAKATDAVKDRFGETAVRYGRELRFEGKDGPST